MRVRDRVAMVAMEKDLRRSTMLSYKRLLGGLGILDLPEEDVTLEMVVEALWGIENPNTRRSTAIAVRSVLGLKPKIGKGIRRKYDLPDEDTLRMALMFSPHEVRGLLMMYAGLRIGEACAITGKDVQGTRLRADKQVQQLHETGKPTTVKISPVKATEDDVAIPVWLAERLAGVDTTAKPDCVRESLRRAGAKVGIHINPHMLRHWYGTTLLKRSGGKAEFVQKQMRHANLASTMVYIDYDDDDEIEQIFGGGSVS